jgi:uncharacterized oligopeptide transporter (OPT) family protein
MSDSRRPNPDREWLENVYRSGTRQLTPRAVAAGMPGYNSIAMFLGGLMAEISCRRKPQLAERTVVPVAPGFVAGESLMGVLVAVLIAIGALGK